MQCWELTDSLAGAPVYTAMEQAGGVAPPTHHAGILLLLRAQDQVTAGPLRGDTRTQASPSRSQATKQIHITVFKKRGLKNGVQVITAVILRGCFRGLGCLKERQKEYPMSALSPLPLLSCKGNDL